MQKEASGFRNIILGIAITLGTLALVGLLIRSESGGTDPNAPPSCEALIPKIVKMSKDKEVSILKISSDELDVFVAEDEVWCMGRARWSNGSRAFVTFYWERDADGDIFIGYQMND